MKTRTVPAATLLIALVTAVACMAAEPVDVLTIDSFERPDALEAWELRPTTDGETVTEHATDGERAVRLDYPEYEQGNEQWPAAILSADSGLLPTDWTGWESVVLDVYCEPGPAPVLKVQISAAGERYQRPLTIEPGQANTCTVDLRGVRSMLDLSRVEALHLYMTRPPHASTLFVDNVRLEAYPVDAGGLRFVSDPFGAGHVAVTGSLSREGRWRIGVVSDDDHTIATAAGEGLDVQWRWDGRTAAGEPAEPGEYRIVARVTDPRRPNAPPSITRLGRTEILPGGARSSVLMWEEPTTKKIMLFSRPGEDQPVATGRTTPAMKMQFPRPEPITVQIARNEIEGTQLVILAREQTRLTAAVQGLRHTETDEPFAGEVELLQVGYAKTERPPRYDVDYVGWWPDPLIPVEQIPGGEMVAEPYECMPLWVNVHSTKQTRPGVYEGFVAVTVTGGPMLMPLRVTVHDVTVPDSTTIRTGFALYEGMIANTYGDAFDDDLLFEFRRFMADHRINPSDIYRSEFHDIDELKYFDERDQLNAFCVLRIRRSEDGDGWHEEQLAALKERLDPFVERLREEGLAEKGYFYGFDERGEEYYAEMARVGQFLQENYPEIPFMTTARDHTYGVESGLDEVDIWVPLTPYYDPELAEAARERGKHVWWYICIGPRHPYANWFVEYPAIEPRLLWWMTWDYGSKGFLYYTMSRWPNAESPMTITGSNRTDWDPDSYKGANGDGCLIVAGPEGPLSTIRAENIRDGIEDHELLTMLEQQRGDGGALGHLICDKVITSLTDFTRDTAHFGQVRRRLLEECAR